MNLGSFSTSTAVVVALGTALLALLTAVVGYLRVAGSQERFRVLWAGGEKDLVAVLSHQAGQLVQLHGELESIRVGVTRAASDVRQSLRHVAVVRYDAVGEMAGQLSFSAAIIDDHGDGLVISSIHARGETRSSAKGISGGISEVTMTPQEQQALASARTGEGSV